MSSLFNQGPAELAAALHWPDDYERTVQRQKYHRFSLPKKDGSLRPILAPGKKLKFLQKTLSNAFQLEYLLHIPDSVHGYVPDLRPEVGKRHILSNAQTHFGQPYLLNLDVDRFFPSTDSLRLMDTLREWFPEMPHATLELILGVCIYENELPTGAPSSPVLSNMSFLPIDRVLEALCAEQQVYYTRYVDDLSFSGEQPLAPEFEKRVRETVAEFGYTLNTDKSKHYGPTDLKEVTGLILTPTDIEVSSELLHNLGRCIKEYEQLRWLSRQLESDRRWLKYKVKHTEQSIRGQLAFLEQIEGKDDDTFLEYQRQFERARHERPPSYDFYF